jgi:hypothetical protein
VLAKEFKVQNYRAQTESPFPINFKTKLKFQQWKGNNIENVIEYHALTLSSKTDCSIHSIKL